MEETRRVLGYTPHVRLREGLREFVAWYRDYHRQRKLDKASDNRVQLKYVSLRVLCILILI